MATKSSSSPSSTRACLCSPTKHPGSFRCSLHRSLGKVSSKSATPHVNRQREESKAAMMMMMTASPSSSSSSKTSLIKAFLMQIIKPSSHDIQRRRNFHPKPTRFCPLNSSNNGVAVS
ncbi:uncharacterized protein LOC111318518 [Durio zibethinus]|uniref:Uncharacterized protein LOC111318518 n=1 Tax=Durio zibethinus TaxID=66656 RepID=A0A6P6BJ71_DURZI|nr:uncharacterized protein LOC111318518 [Durio zibethinus]